jgi:hypothetical protein
MICLLISIILNNNPTLDHSYALNVAKYTYIYSEVFNTDPILMQALFMKESSYDLSAINKLTNDYGIGQVNKFHIKADEIDKSRLTSDLDYSIKHSVRIFSWFYKKYPKEEAIKRYNCGTKKDCVKNKSVEDYYKKVLKFKKPVNVQNCKKLSKLSEYYELYKPRQKNIN